MSKSVTTMAWRVLHEGPRIEFVERQTAPLVLPRFVEIVIQPSQNIRHGVDHLDIGLGIKVAKQLVCIFQDVDVADFPHRPMPINARPTAWAARRWPAPADADSTSTLPSSAILFTLLRCEISVSVRPFSDCNEPGPESGSQPIASGRSSRWRRRQ